MMSLTVKIERMKAAQTNQLMCQVYKTLTVKKKMEKRMKKMMKAMPRNRSVISDQF